MKISKINEYSYSYAEYLVSDGTYEIRCVCNSVPLADGSEPQIGMPIKMLYAFCLEDIFLRAKIFYMRSPYICHNSNVGLSNVRQIINFTEIAHSHFQNRSG